MALKDWKMISRNQWKHKRELKRINIGKGSTGYNAVVNHRWGEHYQTIGYHYKTYEEVLKKVKSYMRKY